jgi:hypothetical protein
MAEIKRANGRDVVDYMARDASSLLDAMRARIPDKLPEWRDYASEADFGNVLLELFAHMGDILSYYQDRVANESFLGTARTRRSIIQHLRLIGYKLATAAPAATTLTLTVPATCEETVTIRQGDALATKSQEDRPSVRFEYTRRHPLTIDWKKVKDTDPDTGRKRVADIPIEEGRLVKEEILGTSDGSANQQFTLAHPGLILRPVGGGRPVHRDILLVTEEQGTIQAWTLQDSLAFSRADQADYVIEIDEHDRATVIFGDGAFGAIPTNKALIKVTYRVGGGSHGNVAADTIQTIVDAPQLTLVGAEVTNPDPATGGEERESIEHAVLHAPKLFRSLRRAVTAGDYEVLARAFPGVGKVRAEAAGWYNVNLFVAPAEGEYVSDVLKADLLACFEDKRPITTELRIFDVEYVEVYVTAEIGVEPYYEPDAVEARVREAAGHLLDFDVVDFGDTLYLSKFYEEIEDVPGVAHVTIDEFRSQTQTEDKQASEGKEEKKEGRIELGVNQIPVKPEDAAYAGGIRVLREQEI